SCEYDSHANPVDCQLIIVDEGVKPAVERVYTIKLRLHGRLSREYGSK
ncbi:YnfC family lipoprotein, partial [Shigella boydii]|nr:YnfC family lipoprotein [Shigella boydii]